MKLTALLLGGGTGGHIYPLLAIADELKKQADANIIAVCSTRPVDLNILNEARDAGRVDRVVPIPARTLSPRPTALAKLLMSWPACVGRVQDELRAAVGPPMVAVSTGGFVAVPAARACKLAGVPLVLVALDNPPGKATKLLARGAAARLSAAPGDLPDWVKIDPIVRTEARPVRARHAAARALGVDDTRRTILVLGGSQGARSINQFISALVRTHGPELDRLGWQIVHQCGAAGEAEARAAVADASVPVLVRAFLNPIGDAYAAADLIVSRGGAGSINEIALAGVPALILPYPHHADRHQAHNARPLIDLGGAVLADDHIDPDANLADAGAILLDLVRDPERLNTMRTALQSHPPSDGAQAVANECFALIRS